MNREYSTSFYTRSRKSDRDRKPEHSSAPPDILDVLDALTRLGYKHTGSNGNRRAQCPAHDGGGLNLSIRKGDGGRTLLTCWSRQCSYREIMHALGFGLGKPIAGTARPDRPARAAPKPAEPNLGIARAIWDAAKPATGTIAHDYLAGRYVWPPPELGVSLPDSIRCLATADAPARTRGWGGLPKDAVGAIVYRYVRPDGETAAVSIDALAGARLVSPRFRRTVGSKTGAVFPVARTSGDKGHAAIAEGEVSALAAAWLCMCTAWATGGTSGVDVAPVQLLAGRTVTLCVDGDGPGADWALDMAARIRKAGAREALRESAPGNDAADDLAASIRIDLALGAAAADAWGALARTGD